MATWPRRSPARSTELGCAVVLAARRVEACESLAQRLETRYGARTLPLAVDVTRADEIEHLVSYALEEFGAIDVLVNSAATFWSAPAEEVPLERGWQRVLDTNLTGTFLSCQAAGRAMLRAGSGSIINVAATGGIKSFLPEMGPNLSYMTSKAAVIKLTRDLAAQWATGVSASTRSLRVRSRAESASWRRDTVPSGHGPTSACERRIHRARARQERWATECLAASRPPGLLAGRSSPSGGLAFRVPMRCGIRPPAADAAGPRRGSRAVSSRDAARRKNVTCSDFRPA